VEIPAFGFMLFQNSPNPFNPSTTVRYCLPEKCATKLEIFDIAGRRITVLVDCIQEAGNHAASWRGLNDQGAPAASGIYFYRLSAGKERYTRKMVLLR
jgi:hypothetical protein